MTDKDREGLQLLERHLTAEQYKQFVRSKFPDEAERLIKEYREKTGAVVDNGPYAEFTAFIPATVLMETPKSLGIGSVGYSKNVQGLIDAIGRYRKDHPEAAGSYDTVLEKAGIKWDMKPMEDADVSNADAETVMALLIGAERAEKFNDGAFAEFWNRGCIRRWLLRLLEIDKAETK